MIQKLTSRIADKHFDKWLGAYLRDRVTRKRAQPVDGPRHVLFAICDHWEPEWADASAEQADARAQAWFDHYPAMATRFRDADGHHPRHSFFFPGEQYKPRWLDELGRFAREGLGEVELHLHHDGDTVETLRRDLERFVGEIASHGHFTRDPGGRARYAFIHGNWCLANGRDDGRY